MIRVTISFEGDEKGFSFMFPKKEDCKFIFDNVESILTRCLTKEITKKYNSKEIPNDLEEGIQGAQNVSDLLGN